jgi:hypothetical protein
MSAFVHISYAHNRFLFSQQICHLSALRLGVFTKAHKYRVADLSSEFRLEHASILARPRGAGYWLWKPELIRMTLEQLREGDVVMYTDAATYFTRSPRALLERCEDVLGFHLLGHCTEVRWTKADARHAIGDFEGQQMCATVHMYRKTARTLEFLRAWFNASVRDNYHLLDDTPSVAPNHPDFREHRWDQSLFSLTYKSFGFDTSYPDPTQWGNDEDAARQQRGYGQFLLHHRRRNPLGVLLKQPLCL